MILIILIYVKRFNNAKSIAILLTTIFKKVVGE